MKRFFAKSCWLVLFIGFALASCQSTQEPDFKANELGKSYALYFGRIDAIRDAKIEYKATGTGAVTGTLAGAVGGSFVGSGSGNVAAIFGGAFLGVVLGSTAEQLLHDGQAIEYHVILDSGIRRRILQNLPKEGKAPKEGERIFIRHRKGLQRVLKLDELPKGVSDVKESLS